MNKKKLIILTFLAFATFPFIVFAHPGRTDANGCHTNKETGDYHCHTKSNKSVKTEARKTANVQKTNLTEFADCGTKTYCKEMTSCAEAKYFLSTCRLTRLDGDNDGIPCESICK